MGDLETSLTWSEGIKLFQDGLYNVIKTRGKKNESPREQKLSDLLPDEDENTTRQIAELHWQGMEALSGKLHWILRKYQSLIPVVHLTRLVLNIMFFRLFN